MVEYMEDYNGCHDILYKCKICNTELKRVNCSVSSFGSVLNISSGEEFWLILLRCPNCKIVYAVDGYSSNVW